MGDLSKLITRMRYWCSEANLGYDQAQRWDIRPGGEADCSSLVIHALKEAGFDTGGATYTGNMRAALTARGWQVVAVRPTSAANLRAGDILLNDTNHVALYLGGGYLGQASIDERGRASGGRSGDQTDHETNVNPFYVYRHGGWSAVLRYVGGQTAASATPTIAGSSQPYNPNGYGAAYVKDVQSRLVELGYSVGASGADGILGADTYSAVKAYQKDHGLAVDGIPGPDTLGALKAGKGKKAAAATATATGKIDEDGWWGQATTRALQEVLGTPQDSTVSSQDAGWKPILAACTSGWEFVPSGQAQGSQLITAMQARMGITADGIAGPGTVKALEAHYGFSQDGHLDGPSNTVRAMQRALNSGRF